MDRVEDGGVVLLLLVVCRTIPVGWDVQRTKYACIVIVSSVEDVSRFPARSGSPWISVCGLLDS